MLYVEQHKLIVFQMVLNGDILKGLMVDLMRYLERGKRCINL